MAQPAFILRELTGDRRKIVFRGRGLPYRPLAFEGEQRVQNDTPAGAPRSIPTVIGPRELPTTINGWWKDIFIGVPVFAGGRTNSCVEMNGTPVWTVKDLARLIDSVRIAGQLLEVEWSGIVRHCILKRFRQTWHNEHDLQYEIEFEVTSRGDAEAPFTAPAKLDPSTVSRRMRQAYRSLIDVPAPASGIGFRFTTGLDKLRRSLERSINAVEDTVTGLVGAVSRPIREVSDLANTLASVKSECDEMLAYLAATPRYMRSTRGTAYVEAPANDTVQAIQDLQVAQWQYDARVALRNLRSAAMEALEASVIDDPKRGVIEYRARGGEDLRDVARRFYGSEDQWRDLMEYNDLASAQLAAGDVVLVPRTVRQGVA